ncbi:MAG: c-type cytochrome biogenesis protein CcsB, partial [Betaproteobacteria bacterium]
MNTTTLDIGKSSWRLRVGLADVITSLVLIAGAAYALQRYGASMDVYETWILIGAVPSLIGLVWLWPTLRGLSLGVGAATLLAIHLYGQNTDAFGADLAAADKVFLLKYFLSSQSAILWMSMLFFMSTVFYWIGLLAGNAT